MCEGRAVQQVSWNYEDKIKHLVPCWVKVILVIIIVIRCLAIFLFIWDIW